MIKIVIIDDHAVLREGLIKLLNNLDDFQVVAQYGNGYEFIENFPMLKNTVDVFILDYSMPIVSGLEILEKIHNELDDANFLILSQSIDLNLKHKFYALGAKGFLTKTCSAEELRRAIHDIVNTGFYNIKENLQSIKNAINNFNIASLLTARELEFIKYSCDEKEYTYQEMADLMNVSAKTVDYYRKNVFEKLNVKSKSGLILQSYKYKLTPPFL
ncbi:response regulator [Flavobacterium sp. NST-5]|uniref:Response regulator n=1 Tax=Flavobacterium ichthyis TaxID=2698827 RepID=A0ABW9ZA84_9FLAO|nr:response regulator transcription factor [Flavobacterium ichthyis]NBL64005.1 response regulator [Flavobacterium ichthyis]